MNKINKFTMYLGVIGTLVFALTFAATPASAQITGTGTLKVGSNNSSVRAVQQLLASNTDMYPAGLVTGYYGSMTKAAVEQFQLFYDLAPDGITGPNTKAKMNSLISLGRGLDVYAPAISNVTVTPSGNTATIAFSTSEPVTMSAYYDLNTLAIRDSGKSYGLTHVSGAIEADNVLSTNKQVTLTSLAANANYNYTVVATDASGNVSLIWPRVFRSN